MGFLSNFLKNKGSNPSSSFRDLSEEELEAHMGISQYGDFKLTDAVRPSYDLEVVPEEGFTRQIFHDQNTGAKIPVLMASVSEEKLFDVFLDLVNLLGEQVDVVLETSHKNLESEDSDLYREGIDTPVLTSTLMDYEDFLLNDGCTGLAVLNPKTHMEVQIDSHKLIFVYGDDNLEFIRILTQYGIKNKQEMKFITEAEHVHSSDESYEERFKSLTFDFGIEDQEF